MGVSAISALSGIYAACIAESTDIVKTLKQLYNTQWKDFRQKSWNSIKDPWYLFISEKILTESKHRKLVMLVQIIIDMFWHSFIRDHYRIIWLAFLEIIESFRDSHNIIRCSKFTHLEAKIWGNNDSNMETWTFCQKFLTTNNNAYFLSKVPAFLQIFKILMFRRTSIKSIK